MAAGVEGVAPRSIDVTFGIPWRTVKRYTIVAPSAFVTVRLPSASL
jgi:hypothetical protein